MPELSARITRTLILKSLQGCLTLLERQSRLPWESFSSAITKLTKSLALLAAFSALALALTFTTSLISFAIAFRAFYSYECNNFCLYHPRYFFLGKTIIKAGCKALEFEIFDGLGLVFFLSSFFILESAVVS